VFRGLDQRPLEIKIVTSDTLVNLGRPRTVETLVKEDATIAAVERLQLGNRFNISRELQMTKRKFSKYFLTVSCIHSAT
jgi:hypothetical protein